MGKASSSKKIARAARAGGGRVSSGQPRSLLFPGVLTLVVVLGVALVAYARADRRSEDMGGPPQIGDHIHLSFGVNVCDEWLRDIPTFENRAGIHTHGDGVLHAHPYSQLGVGANATLGLFLDDAKEFGDFDVAVTDDKITWFGDEYVEGEHECEGVEDPVIRLAYWTAVTEDDNEPTVTTGDFGSQRLTEDGGGITIYYGARNADIPKPPTSENLFELGAIDSGQAASTTTTAPGGDPADGGDAGTEDDPTATTEADGAGDTTSTTAADAAADDASADEERTDTSGQ